MADDPSPEGIPEMDVPPFATREHYASIAHLLSTSGFTASVFTNGLTMGVQVSSVSDTGESSKVVWGNHDATWVCSVIDVEQSGTLRTLQTDLPSHATAEAVAYMILTTNYDDAA